MTSFEVVWFYRQAFWHGFLVTAELVAISVIIGTTVGLFLEWLCSRLGRRCRSILDIIAFPFAVIPALVVLFWFYYPAQSLTGVSVSPFWTASITLITLNSLAVYRIAGDALKDFPSQCIATAKVSGMSDQATLRFIQVPLLLRSALPRWIDQQVIVLQTSVFASLISVEELFRVAQRINSQVYQPVLIYSAMGLVFLVTAGTGAYVAEQLRRRYHRDFSER